MGSTEPQLGFCTWQVCENILYGDDVFAGIYGFTVEQAATGVPVEDVIGKIIPGDRERIAKEVHDAILDGRPYSTTYSVLVKGRLRQIAYNGRCLRDADGLPSFFSGTISEQDASMVFYCRSALDLARKQQNELASRYLASALNALGDRAAH